MDDDAGVARGLEAESAVAGIPATRPCLHILPEFIVFAFNVFERQKRVKLCLGGRGEHEAVTQKLVGDAVHGAVQGQALGVLAGLSAHFQDGLAEAGRMDAGHEATDERVVLEFLEEIVDVELELGVEHHRRALGHVGIGYELGVLDEVVLGEHHHLDGVYFEHYAHFVAAHFWVVGGGLQLDEVAEGIAVVEFAEGVEVHVFEGAIAGDELCGLGPAVLVRLEFGEGLVDVEIRISEAWVDFHEDEAPLEIPSGTLSIVFGEAFRIELARDERVVRMHDEIQMLFFVHSPTPNKS